MYFYFNPFSVRPRFIFQCTRIYVHMFQMRATSFVLCKYILSSFIEVKVLQQQNMFNVHHMLTLLCEVFKWNYEQHVYTHIFKPMGKDAIEA